MYCSGCGVRIHDDLNYCNRCGSKIPKQGTASVAEGLSQAVGYVGGFGLLAFIFVILVLVKTGVPTNMLVPISFLYLATLFGICFLLIRQAGVLTRMRVAPDDREMPNRPASPYLRPVTTAQLEEHQNPAMGSVIEHTTRALEEVSIKRER